MTKIKLRNSEQLFVLPDPKEVTVAPHRYRYDREMLEDDYADVRTHRHREFVEACAYKKGDVVHFQDGDESRLAVISFVTVDYDRWGDRRAKYRAHPLNKDGERFSQNWKYIWPGQIQRGYWKAGFNDDMPEDQA